MKLISTGIILASAATLAFVSADTTQAIHMPARPTPYYCLYVSVQSKAGYVQGCGYTSSECRRYLPGVLAEAKKKYPRATAGCARQ